MLLVYRSILQRILFITRNNRFFRLYGTLLSSDKYLFNLKVLQDKKPHKKFRLVEVYFFTQQKKIQNIIK